MKLRAIGFFILISAIIFLAVVNYLNDQRRGIPFVFSPKTLLAALWDDYKEEMIEDTGRTLDKTRNFATTSEGQSYTMMRAVWMDDKETFDKAWTWTKDNLRRPDGLFSWLFGLRPDGTFGILTEENGQNSASDADQDIALALIFASSRWGHLEYLSEAQETLDAIWATEVVEAGGRPYLAANNVEKTVTGDILMNPSYLAPYAYRIFQQVDEGHDWEGLIDTSYEVIQASSSTALTESSPAGLPPDWISIDRSTGEVKPPKSNLPTNYGFDALRTPWRLALDWVWFNEERAKQALSSFHFLEQEWERQQKIYSTYAHDGTVLVSTESPAMYGGSLGYFLTTDPNMLKEVYEQKLKILYNNDNFSWKTPLNYYDDNWAWFGIALYHNQLNNLHE